MQRHLGNLRNFFPARVVRTCVGSFVVFLLVFNPNFNASSQRFISITDDEARIGLTHGILILEDPAETLTLDSVVNFPDQSFVPFENMESPPASNSVQWLKIFLINNVQSRSDWIISLGNHRSPDYVKSFVKQSSGHYQTGSGGALCRFEELSIKDRTASKLPVHLTPGDTSVVFLRVSTISDREISLSSFLETPDYTIHHSVMWAKSQAAVHGALIIMCIFSFFVFLIDKDKAYLFYALYLGNLSLLLLGITGEGADALGLENPADFIYIGHITQCLSSIFYFTFAKYFTDLERTAPETIKWINAMIWFNILLIGIQFIVLNQTYNYNAINGTAAIKSAIDVLLMIYLSGKLIRSGKRINYYFVVGSAVLVLSGITTILLVLIFEADYGAISHEAGAILDVAIFSVGLGHRMKLNEREKRKAQQKLIDQLRENQKLQSEINRDLELKVQERTSEIMKQSEEILAQNNKLEHSNKEKEILLSEIHHRVKNNLQIISSLLSIQSHGVDNETARMALWQGQSRVQAMGLIHENIYKADNFAKVDMDVYLKRLTGILVESANLNVKPAISIDAGNAVVNIDTAIPIGLITNELITNCIKHAFADTANPGIDIRMSVNSAGHLHLSVGDNGKGLGGENKNSFGLKLVERLASQMNGRVCFESKKGLTVNVHLQKFQIEQPV